MTQLYLRQAKLIVFPAGGTQGLDLGDLRFKFTTRQFDLQSPNSADIRVYNVADQTKALIEKEFTRVVIQAGYSDESFGTIFSGNIMQIRKGRENATDTYLDILAGDGDQAYNFATVNASLAAGSKPQDQVDLAVKAMSPYNITQGYTPALPQQQLPRGKAVYGLSRDVLRNVAQSHGTSWSIQNERVQMVPHDAYLPGDAVVLTAKTGMIGLPEQTIEGIKVRSLLNSKFVIGGRVKIDNKSIQQYKISLAYTAINFVPKISDDGFYRILVAQHTGDTRGNDWYSDLICIALDDTVPMALAAQGRA